MAEIYALFSARDGRVRYVGKTIGGHEARFESHKRGQTGRYISSVYTWVRKEWRFGFPVESVVLESCADDVCEEAETRWMNRFPNLLNERKYYNRNCRSSPIISEIRRYMRNHQANCGGFRGVFWWGTIDYYSVLKPNGDWLLGGEAPGRGGNIYFLDRTAALNARDRSRRFSNMNWLPDIEEEFDWALGS